MPELIMLTLVVVFVFGRWFRGERGGPPRRR